MVISSRSDCEDTDPLEYSVAEWFAHLRSAGLMHRLVGTGHGWSMALRRTMLEMIHERLSLGNQAPEGICHSSTQNNYDAEASTDFTMTKVPKD